MPPIASSSSTWGATPSPAPRRSFASPTASAGSISARTRAEHGRGDSRIPHPRPGAGRHLCPVRRRPDADLRRARYRQCGARRILRHRRLCALCRHGRPRPVAGRGPRAGHRRRLRPGARGLSAADRAPAETPGTTGAGAALPGADTRSLRPHPELAAGGGRRRISESAAGGERRPRSVLHLCQRPALANPHRCEPWAGSALLLPGLPPPGHGDPCGGADPGGGAVGRHTAGPHLHVDDRPGLRVGGPGRRPHRAAVQRLSRRRLHPHHKSLRHHHPGRHGQSSGRPCRQLHRRHGRSAVGAGHSVGMAERHRLRHDDPSAAGAAERPVRKETAVIGLRVRTLAIAILAGAGLAAPLVWSHPFVLHIAIQALIWALFAASWDLLSGYTGQVSFGHAGFFSIGAYTAAILTKLAGLSSWLGMTAALLLCAVVGLCVGFPALRLRGHYLALVTLGFGEILQLIATNWENLTGGPFRMPDYRPLPGPPTAPPAPRLDSDVTGP